MTREIKYRYWYSGKMIVVGQIEFMSDGSYRVNDELVGGVLMEVIGLKDKNRRDIYEGDILNSGDDEIIVQPPGWYVCEAFTEYGYENMGGFRKDYQSYNEVSSTIRDCEIIGNVYQNPELVK